MCCHGKVKNKPFARQKQNGLFFYCCLLNKITIVIIKATFIVIARGDLGNAIALWDLPVVQAQIAKICNAAEKPFMIVTQTNPKNSRIETIEFLF